MVAPLWVNVLPEYVGQSSLNFFRGCYTNKTLTMQNFVAIGQTSLEKVGGGRWTEKQLPWHTAEQSPSA